MSDTCGQIRIFFVLLVLVCMAFAKSHKPEQIRLQMENTNVRSMLVTYVTGSSANPDAAHPDDLSKVPKTQCMYGESKDTLREFKEGTFVRFEDKKYTSDIHTCIMTDLKPGIRYFYQVGDASKEDGLSDIYSFFAGYPTKWALYGDFGTDYLQYALQNLIDDARNGVFNGVVHLGDIAYDLHKDEGLKGDKFLNSIQPFAASMPYHVVVGNHENKRNFAQYLNRFSSLNYLAAASNSKSPMWYSQDVPLAHFVHFHTELFLNDTESPIDYNQIDAQYKWLESDLIEANKHRDERPWVITFAHKCDYHNDVDFSVFKRLFTQYGVDAHFCGHQHNYNRMFPGFDGVYEAHPNAGQYLNPTRTFQTVIGSAGAVDTIEDKACPFEGCTSFYSCDYGYGVLNQLNSTHLQLDFRRTARGIPANNGQLHRMYNLMKRGAPSEVIDTLTVIQENHGPKYSL